jgi:hypothetical protein
MTRSFLQLLVGGAILIGTLGAAAHVGKVVGWWNVPRGQIVFGHAWSNLGRGLHIVGQTDTFTSRVLVAWIGHLRTHPHRDTVTQAFYRVGGPGAPGLVWSEPFADPNHDNMVANQIPACRLQAEGVKPPGTYTLRYLEGSTVLAASNFEYAGQPISGTISFGSAMKDNGHDRLSVVSSHSTFHAGGSIAWVACFTRQSGTSPITRIITGTPNHIRYATQITWTNGADSTATQTGIQFSSADVERYFPPPNKYRVRYIQGSAVLAEGWFVVVR